uniref:Uncharacterized protein n=1 Tax=Acrobeloides nanus TaxID=290746 RepID=A0A914C2B7_9BILA
MDMSSKIKEEVLETPSNEEAPRHQIQNPIYSPLITSPYINLDRSARSLASTPSHLKTVPPRVNIISPVRKRLPTYAIRNPDEVTKKSKKVDEIIKKILITTNQKNSNNQLTPDEGTSKTERIVIIKEPEDANSSQTPLKSKPESGKELKLNPPSTSTSIQGKRAQQNRPKIKEEVLSDNEERSITSQKQKPALSKESTRHDHSYEKKGQYETYERPIRVNSTSSYESDANFSSEDRSVPSREMPALLKETISDVHLTNILKSKISDELKPNKDPESIQLSNSEHETSQIQPLRGETGKRGRGRPRIHVPLHKDDPNKRKQREYHQTYWVQRENRVKTEVTQKYENLLKEILRNIHCQEDREMMEKLLKENGIQL